jgi:uncharacterized protein YidB (DUF937 family)
MIYSNNFSRAARATSLNLGSARGLTTLMAHSGMSRDELIAGLSQQLLELINQLTPNGRHPTEQEASRLI